MNIESKRLRREPDEIIAQHNVQVTATCPKQIKKEHAVDD